MQIRTYIRMFGSSCRDGARPTSVPGKSLTFAITIEISNGYSGFSCQETSMKYFCGKYRNVTLSLDNIKKCRHYRFICRWF